VGDGPERRLLERRGYNLVVDRVVRFLGAFPNTAIGSLYEVADVFVMPSLHDYRSVAVLEALRFGKPVIDSAYDGNAGDSVRDGINGFIFDPLVPASLETAMERFISQPDIAQDFGQRSASVMDKHTPQAAASALRDVLSAVQLS
jgi:glycosyltransferase involved in cell wall biosynthesis